MSDREQREQGRLQLNSVLRLFRDVYQVLMRAEDEWELACSVCEVITRHADYRFAWIGYVQQATRDLHPVAQAGAGEGYLSSVRITCDDSIRGQCPSGTAIKTKRPVVVQDLAVDGPLNPWRDEACRRGFASCLALPLLVGEEAIATLNIYSHRPHAFANEEIPLFEELAADLALGIQKIRQRRQWDKGHAAATPSEELYRRAKKQWEDTVDAIQDASSSRTWRAASPGQTRRHAPSWGWTSPT